MAKFQILAEENKGHLLLKLVGTIDEDSTFKDLSISGTQSIAADFEKVDAINSCGVREWVKWLETVPAEKPVEYFNCPSMIVDQINMVGGFLRKGIKVNSFYVPYYCENCKHQTNVLVTAGKDFIGAKITVPENIKCSKCQGDTEIDVMEAKYFKFLQRQV